jgi:hypothetical protein
MIASARLIYGSLPNEPPGRQRIYKTAKEADHAFYIRKRDRRKMRAVSPNNGATHPLPASNAPVSLQQRLEEACQANYDARASVEPIEALLAQGLSLIPTSGSTDGLEVAAKCAYRQPTTAA